MSDGAMDAFHDEQDLARKRARDHMTKLERDGKVFPDKNRNGLTIMEEAARNDWKLDSATAANADPSLRPDRGLMLDYDLRNESHSYIRTSTGRVVAIDDPVWCLRNGQVCIEDIAHALAYTNRFGGHARDAYTVAQHCVRAYHLADHGDKFWALMHDAPEAYMGDLVSPLKRLASIRPAWVALEHEWDKVIRSLFSVRAPQGDLIGQEERVKWIDLQLLGREIIDLLPYGEEDARNINYEPGHTPDLLDPDEGVWSHKEAKLQFLAAFTACTGQSTTP